MTEATTLATLQSVLVHCRDLAEVAETWRANQDAIKTLAPHDVAALIITKDRVKDHFSTLPLDDNYVADWMEGRA